MSGDRDFEAVLQQSRRVLNHGSKSFAAATRLLGRRERESATLLYAWCRHCDDVIDGQELGHGCHVTTVAPAQRLAELAVQTRAALRGASTQEAPFQALQHVVRRHAIPHRYPMELLEGFAMDVEGRRYADLDDVLLYCYHVAGVVGLMMAHLMGVRDEPTLDRACELGIALQLTNIARDVLDDAARGRVYLPLDWLDAENVSPGDIAAPRHRRPMADLVARLLEVAETYYRSADLGLGALPLRSAWSIAVARGVYADIGRVVKRRGVAAWDERVVVSKPRKLAWLVRGAADALGRHVLHRVATETSRQPLWKRPRSWRPAGQRVTLERTDARGA